MEITIYGWSNRPRLPIKRLLTAKRTAARKDVPRAGPGAASGQTASRKTDQQRRAVLMKNCRANDTAFSETVNNSSGSYWSTA
jgi:hypothetical protein